MNHKLAKQRYTILGFLLSMFFMYLAFKNVDIMALGVRLRTADLTYMLMALLPLSASYISRAFLWQRIILKFKFVDFFNVFSALMIGFLGNNVLPGRAGEFMRAYVLGSKENIGKTFILGSIVIERLFDILILLLFLAISTFMFPMPRWAKHILLMTSIILLIVLALSYLFLLKRVPLLAKLEAKPFFLLNPKGRFLIKSLDSFISSLGILKDARSVLTIFILSLLSWVFATIMMLLTFKSVAINIPFYGLLFVISVINLGLLIPSSPGYLGTYQFLCVIALSTFSIEKTIALGFSIIYHALWFIPLTLFGLVFLWRENVNLAKLRSMREAIQG